MEQIYIKLLEQIKTDLSENYNSADDSVLSSLLEDIIHKALDFANREETESNITKLSYDIKTCVKILYMQRGTEDTNSKSDGGESSNFKNAIENLRIEIIKSGKRLMY